MQRVQVFPSPNFDILHDHGILLKNEDIDTEDNAINQTPDFPGILRFTR